MAAHFGGHAREAINCVSIGMRETISLWRQICLRNEIASTLSLFFLLAVSDVHQDIARLKNSGNLDMKAAHLDACA